MIIMKGKEGNIKLRTWCLYSIAIVLITSNVFNYFISYKALNDIDLQWKVFNLSIGIEPFLFSIYIWLSEIIKLNNSFRIIISGWI